VSLPEIETERLVLRLARPSMAAAQRRFMEENFEGHLDRWSPRPAAGFFTEIYWRDRLALAIEDYIAGRAARFVLQARGVDEDGPILGNLNYTNVVRGVFLACHLGYQVSRQAQGRGLMTEALRAGNAWVFGTLRLHRIMANYHPDNARSARVLERLGFVREGFARDYLYIDGDWRDHVLTALVNPDPLIPST
jgi:[ribosomal protein S5]-alanine N-acetyltransferase